MTQHLRGGAHPSEFSRARRRDESGGEVPSDWNAPVVDADAVGILDGAEFRVVETAGRIWIPYEQLPSGVAPICLYESKLEGEAPGFSVTVATARLAGLPAFRVTRMAAGGYRVLAVLPGGESWDKPVKDVRAVVSITEMAARAELRKRAA